MRWRRLPDPILKPEEGDDWEEGGLYKESLVEHEGMFYLFYNAKNKNKSGWVEQIGLATSSIWRPGSDTSEIHYFAYRQKAGKALLSAIRAFCG